MSKISRKKFLGKMTGFGLMASTIQIVPSRLLGKSGVSPSGRVNVACVGTGMMAGIHYRGTAGNKRIQIMGLCDVSEKNMNNAEKTINDIAKKRQDCAFRPVDKYKDYQEIINRDDIDAVWICTPDHWHVQQAVYAIERGKAVYLEKPMSLTVEEGRILADTVKKYNGVLQVGSQQRSDVRFRRAAEIVRNGYMGKLKKINVNIGVFPPMPTNLKEEAIPAGFDYDKWLGQTPWRPYNKEIVKQSFGGGWRCFYEYGARKEGDWGAHHFDIVQWALGKDNSGPTEFHPINTEGYELRHYRYEDGTTVFVNDPSVPNGIQFISERGEMFVSRGKLSSNIPGLLTKAFKSSDERLTISANHAENFLDAVFYGNKNICTAEIGHRSATICQLMSIARRTNESFKWDPSTETITKGSDKVKSMLSRPRRAPYFIGS